MPAIDHTHHLAKTVGPPSGLPDPTTLHADANAESANTFALWIALTVGVMVAGWLATGVLDAVWEDATDSTTLCIGVIAAAMAALAQIVATYAVSFAMALHFLDGRSSRTR